MTLKGNAAEVPEILPSSSTENFDEIMNALHRKYGSDHKTEIYHMELRRRMQKAGEKLQHFAFEIERLVQSSDPGENQTLAEKNSSFRETVSFALVQETKRIVCMPQVWELRCHRY